MGVDVVSGITGHTTTLRMSENRVLRKISGPDWEEVTGGWRKLHNGKLRNSTPLKILLRNRDSVFTVSRLRVGRSAVRFPGAQKILFLPQSHPALYCIGTRGSFFGHKAAGVSN
jgi:hypothetical protein